MDETIQLIFTIAFSVFDMVIVMIYYGILFDKKKEWVTKPIYCSFYTLICTVFWFSKVFDMIWIGYMVLSFTQYLLLTLLYETKKIVRLFSSISVLVFAMISEVISSGIFLIILTPDQIETSDSVELYALMLSKLIKFMMVITIMLILKKKNLKADFKDYLCLTIVPLISIFIIIAVTIDAGDKSSSITAAGSIAVLGIMIINFIVYYLLRSIIQANELKERQSRMDTQFMFQEKKYEQTSMSFKNISGIIHDTNKHLVYLRECAMQKNYDEAIRYIDIAMNNVSNSYKRINTGHLVIDALVSNAYNTAQANITSFKTDIKIDKTKINIERYDLSVALGNLLDNAIEACVKISNLDDRFINVTIFTSDNALVMNICNSTVGGYFEQGLKTDKKDKINHGYGLGNVNMIAEKYGGSFVTERKESSFEATVVLPLKDD